MALTVEIYDDVIETIDSWGLPDSVRSQLFLLMLRDLETRLSDDLGPIHSTAPVRLRKYAMAIPDPGGLFLHNFVFLVNDNRNRRVVMAGNHRISGEDF